MTMCVIRHVRRGGAGHWCSLHRLGLLPQSVRQNGYGFPGVVRLHRLGANNHRILHNARDSVAARLAAAPVSTRSHYVDHGFRIQSWQTSSFRQSVQHVVTIGRQRDDASRTTLVDFKIDNGCSTSITKRIAGFFSNHNHPIGSWLLQSNMNVRPVCLQQRSGSARISIKNKLPHLSNRKSFDTQRSRHWK